MKVTLNDSEEDSMPFVIVDLLKQGMKLDEMPKNDVEDNDDPWEHLSILPGCTLPKGIKTNFPLLKGMQLTENKMRIVAFIFHPDKDPREVISRMGDTVGTSDDFACLCLQKNIQPKEDILLGHTIEDLMTTYSDYWMKPFESLKYIYVPPEDVNGDWYLMVVSVDERVLYHLCCNKEDAIFEERKDVMKNVSREEVIRMNCVMDVRNQGTNLLENDLLFS
ncbi:hypothetical protein SESBI_13621 [Sesbania bispinosa]|nr:hypothetical protein SESBI_13621 [Sesbania bispinosa]